MPGVRNERLGTEDNEGAERAAVEEKILEFLHAAFLKEAPIDAETSLFLSGLLDSLSMVTLLSFVEEFYHVRLLGEDFRADDFDTVGQIADGILMRGGDAPACGAALPERKRKKGGLSKALRYLKKKRPMFRVLKGPRYIINHFEHPIGYRTLAKHLLLGAIEKFLAIRLEERHLPFIRRSLARGTDLSPLRGEKSIFLFMHQPFLDYLLVVLRDLGRPLNTLVRGRSGPEFLGHEPRIDYHRHVYRPLVSLAALRGGLLAGENVLLAADGLLGRHHIEVRFGQGKITTPRGIYELSRSTGTRIVPLFLEQRRWLPLPAFEIRMGDGCVIEHTPESEIGKIEKIFAWYYAQFSRQPHLWKRIAEEHYAVRPEGTS
jgi:acyl carrier protein